MLFLQRLLSGTASELTSSEREAFSAQELKDGWRLACQTYPTSDCKLGVPPKSVKELTKLILVID